MVPEYWLTEGGQSGTSALLDHLIESHLAESCCFPASPNADPKAKGMVCGLTLDTSQNQLALQYLATVQIIHMARVILLSTAMPMVTKLTRYYHVEALLRAHY